ncbi:MAG: hypothetical protein OHK0053_31330 [Microscillaceae bacterium]
MQKKHFIFIFLISLSFISACGGDDGLPANSVAFENSEESTSEAVGIYNLKLVFGRALESNQTLSFTVSGTAEAGKDYTLGSTSVTVSAGLSEALLSVALIDNGLIQGNTPRTLILTLNNPPAGLVLGNQASITLNIQDDDLPTTAASGFVFDLTWASGNLPLSTVLNADVNLSLLRENNGALETTALNSESTNSFEAIVVPIDYPDGIYALRAYYRDGGLDLDISLAYTPAGQTTPNTVVLDEYLASDADNNSVLKPESLKVLLRFQKTGNSISLL